MKADKNGDSIVDVKDPNPNTHGADNIGKNTTTTRSSIVFQHITLVAVGIPRYCLLTLYTIAMVTIFHFANTLIHLTNSLRGALFCGHRKAVGPFSHVYATLVLLLATITISVSLAFHNMELQIKQWITVVIIVLGYYSLWTAIQAAVNQYCVPLWLEGFFEAVHLVLIWPLMVLVMKVAPSWKQQKIFVSFNALTLTRAAVFILLGQYSVGIIVYIIENLSCVWCALNGCKGKKCAFYYIKGLRRGITLVFIAVMHLFIWNFYFKKKLENVHHRHFIEGVSNIGNSTFICEFIFGFLWSTKNYILLYWQSHTVYERAHKETVMRKLVWWVCLKVTEKKTGDNNDDKKVNPKQDYYLLEFLKENFMISTCKKNKEAHGKREKEIWDKTRNTLLRVAKPQTDHGTPSNDRILIGDVINSGYKYMKRHRTILSIHEKEMVAHAFLQLGYKSDPQCYDNKPEDEESYESFDLLYKFLDSNDSRKCAWESAEIFSQKKGQEKEKNTQYLHPEEFEKFMGRAIKICLQLQDFLRGARDVVTFLNTLMTSFIVVLVVIIWLMLTEILPTKIVVAVSSTILGAAFIFGDTMKTMFQGIVFAYLSHPFTIGDLCIIDQTQLEVKRIEIWRTVFSKVSTGDTVLYPNSVLSTVPIINYEGDLQLHDVVEFSLNCRTHGKIIKALSEKIKQHINDPQNGFVQSEQEKKSAQEDLDRANIREENGEITQPKDEGEGNVDPSEPNQVSLSMISDGGSVIKECVCEIEDVQDERKRSKNFQGSEGSGNEVVEHKDAENKIEEVQQSQGNEGNKRQKEASSTNGVIDNLVLMTEQSQGNIKLTVHFPYLKAILDLTSGEVFNEKLKKKAQLLENIIYMFEEIRNNKNKDVADTRKKAISRSLSSTTATFVRLANQEINSVQPK